MQKPEASVNSILLGIIVVLLFIASFSSIYNAQRCNICCANARTAFKNNHKGCCIQNDSDTCKNGKSPNNKLKDTKRQGIQRSHSQSTKDS